MSQARIVKYTKYFVGGAVLVIFALLILNGIDAIRNPRVYYQDQWVLMSQLHNQHTPLYCTFMPVSTLYDSFGGLFLLPVTVCFDSQWELNRWIDAHYPDRYRRP